MSSDRYTDARITLALRQHHQAGHKQCQYAPYIVTLTVTCCNIHIGAGSRYCAHVSYLSVANDYQCPPPCPGVKGLCPCMLIDKVEGTMILW